MTELIELQEEVGEELAGLRLDQAAAKLFPDYSRARIQEWIRDGQLLLDGKAAKAKDKVLGGELVSLQPEEAVCVSFAPEPLPLDIVFEDRSVIVLDKPAGLVVHPAAGNYAGTLLNGLLAHCPALEKLPRAGIVHRLDKDTSGLMVVAKTLAAHQDLVAQLQARSVSRQYEAVVQGVVTAGGTVDAPLGRHPAQRQKRAVSTAADARDAVTHYRVLTRFRGHSHLRLQLETGRTHQIRVHMAHIGFPLVGDPLYGGRLRLPKGAAPALLDTLQEFRRQALHARSLGFVHPRSGEDVSWDSAPPADFQALLAALANDANAPDV
ncbi:MAG: 23S rRNA pseudouridine(1911/1915/1917) synthase RluD [Pseudomonadales bacterium]|jgi:23S rRNA pseudouridine1911/1915/1917 synthase|nr:23S rRNA pseudouridine(1911/1915/1917) synthase RluD [Pseudomonadales bacterium]